MIQKRRVVVEEELEETRVTVSFSGNFITVIQTVHVNFIVVNVNFIVVNVSACDLTSYLSVSHHGM